MEKSAQILSCEYDKQWTAPNGDTIFYHRLVLSNGDKGNVGVSQMFKPEISQGQTITYTMDAQNRIKLSSNNSNPMTGRQAHLSPPPQNNNNRNYQQNHNTTALQNAKQEGDWSQQMKSRKYGKSPEDAITFILGYASNRHVAKIQHLKQDVPMQEMLDDADIIFNHYKKMLQQAELPYTEPPQPLGNPLPNSRKEVEEKSPNTRTGLGADSVSKTETRRGRSVKK